MTRIKVKTCIVAAALMLASCGTVPINREKAQGMSQDTARSIFNKYEYGYWVKAPFLYKRGFLCKTGKVYIKLNGTTLTATYMPKNNQLWIGKDITPMEICHTAMHFDGLTKDQARELTAALIALGAKIDKLKWIY